jgi:hypothetical protein
MAWDTKGGYRDRNYGLPNRMVGRARAWFAAKRKKVPDNANRDQLRNGSMFYNQNILIDYDFSEYGNSTVYNRAPNQITTSLNKTGGQWVRDTSLCTSGISTSGTTGNARGSVAPFISSVKDLKEFSIDFWMMPNDFTDQGPPRILEIAPDLGNDSHSNCNIAILQGSVGNPYNGNHIQVRLRATNESIDAAGQGNQVTVASNCLSAGVMHHITVSCRAVGPDVGGGIPGRVILALYVDGQLKEHNEIDMPLGYTYDDIFQGWDDSYILSLFDSSHAGGTSGSRQWDGGIFRLRFWKVSLPVRMPYELYLDGPNGDLTCNQVPPSGQQGRPGGSTSTPPFAWNDHYNTSFGFLKEFHVLQNDQAFGGKTIDKSTLKTTFPGTVVPLSGTVTVDNVEGTISYSALNQPNSTPQGTDVFTYRFRDSGGKLSNDASVYVTIASAGTTFEATEPFNNYAGSPPGRYAPHGHLVSDIKFAGGPVSGDLAAKYGIDWVIPWKSTTGPNNDYFKIEHYGEANAHNTQPNIALSGFNLLYPEFDGSTVGRIEITTSGTYENFISYKPIKIKVPGVTLKNFIVDVCMIAHSLQTDTPDAILARDTLWALHNSTADYDPNVALIGAGTVNTSAGPCQYYNASQTGHNWQPKTGFHPYGIQANEAQGSNPVPVNTLLIDGMIKGGTSTTILCGNGMTVKRCNVSEGGGDAIKNSGFDVCCVANWIHHQGMQGGSHADGFQTTSHSSGISIIGNFVDMPSPEEDDDHNTNDFSISPYKSNAVYIAGQTKGSLANVAFVGNWAMGGNNAISYGMGDKWQYFAVKSSIPTATSATANFSLTSGQFSDTPLEAAQFMASSADTPNLTIEKQICKKSGENYWYVIPDRLWSFIDPSGIIVSGDATVAGGWDEAQCSGNTEHAAWGWVDQDNRPCDLMYRPTLEAEDQFGDTQPGGRYTSNSGPDYSDPMKGNYRLVNSDSQQVLGYYGNKPNSNYAPKPMLNFVVADNRWGEHSRYTFGFPDGASNKYDFITGGPSYTLSGTLSGILYSGNYWDYTNQLMGPPGTDPPVGNLPDYNSDLGTISMGPQNMNDLCIPLSGMPHGSPGGGRRSLGDCDDLSAGIPWTGEAGSAAASFDIYVGDPPCAPPWCL